MLGIALAGVAVAIAVVAGVHVETDVLALVPANDPVIRQFKTTIERFGSVDVLLVDVRLEPGLSRDAQLAYADELATQLESWDLIDWVEYRLKDPIATAVPLLDRAMLFMSPDEVRTILGQLDDRGLRRQARRVRSLLLTPQGAGMKELLRVDPFLLLPRLISRIRLGGVGARFDPETGYLIDPSHHHLLMLAKPVRPAQDLVFDRRLMHGIRQRLDEATTAWHEAGWEGEPPRVELAGGYATALDDGRLIVQDLAVGTISAALGVMLLFLLAFRRPAALMYAGVPLVVGLAFTFIFVGITLNHLSSATSAFAALLIGLGVDFVIVLYGRYVEERHRGASHTEAAEAFGRTTGVGVMLGAVTTAATFYAFLITDFRGLKELGLITGTGILFTAAAVFLLLPALLTLSKGRHLSERLHLHSFGADILCLASRRRPRATAVVVALLTAVALVGMFRLGFDDDIRNMRSANNRGVQVRQEIMKAFGLRFSPMMVRVDGPDEDTALRRTREILPALRALVDGKNLAGVDTVAELIPSREAQERVITVLEHHPIDPASLRQRFDAAFRAEGLNPAPFTTGFDHFIAALEVRHPLSLADLKGTALARALDRYLAQYPGGVSSVVYCYPPAGKWRRMAPPALLDLVRNRKHVVLTGTNVISNRLRQIVWGDAGRAAVLGLILVILLLWLDLGSLHDTVLALAPLGLGIVWTLGTMGLLGLEINLMNIFVLTMIIGIGVDYGVHLLHRWRECGGEPQAIAETSKAIAVAALTTVVGFGSLVLSHFPGLRSVGTAAILGALSTAILSMTLLPLLLVWRRP
ncbi:MAG TPA: hypothetical protein ENK19_02250 [Acidobacteria bacterium]|nr:hypothetical protein [Acidobacteriota bacterium]